MKITYRLRNVEGLPGRVVCVRESSSISRDLRIERDRRTTFDGHAHVFADGVRFEDLRGAIQAAWLVEDFTLAAELARRYDFYNLICLRCASALIASVPQVSFAARASLRAAFAAFSDRHPRVHNREDEWIFYQLCMNCWSHTVRDYSSIRTGAPTST